MQIQLKSPKIWVATKPVDFRKAIDGLSTLVTTHFQETLQDQIYVFYNSARNKLKLLAYHRNGSMLIYKRLDKKRFTLKKNHAEKCEINEQELSWLLAGLNWIDMSDFKELPFTDYF